MSEKASIEKYQVNLQTRRVSFQGSEIKIRPKSFELLKLFLENQNDVISKERMLSSIWDDVVVDEQVIFQSIKELRKAFVNIDAIKTFPRKGYAWVADIEVANNEPNNEQKLVDEPELKKEAQQIAINDANSNKYTNWYFKGGASLLLLIIVFSGWFYSEKITSGWQSEQPVAGSILVLPIKEHLNDRDHKWVGIGAMDQLIQQIPASSDYGVMQVDDVLDIMKRAQIPLKDFSNENINQIFVVSGAELIIEAELTGTAGDYQLVYNLRRRKGIQRGVLLTAEVYDAIDQLAEIVATNIGAPIPSPVSYHSDLANQLLAQALDKKISNDYVGTEQYLKSLLELEPENFKAKRLLTEISVYLKKSEQIAEIVDSVELLLSKQGILVQPEEVKREYGRLQFWQGMNELQFGRTDKAQAIFERAREQANIVQDWLYLGYLAEAKGNLYRYTKRYDLAKKQYQVAITNHKIIKCPFGEGNNLLNLAETSFLQENIQLAQKHVDSAMNLAKKRGLSSLQRKAEFANEKYNSTLPDSNIVD